MEHSNGDGKPASIDPASKPPSPQPEAFGRGEHPTQKQEQHPRATEDESSDDPDNNNDGQKQDQKEEPPPKKPFWKRPVLLTIMIVVAVVVIVLGGLYYLHMQKYETTDDAFIDGRIVHVSSRVPGKVQSLDVNDNQWVDANTTLIQIDPSDYQVKVHEAQAAVEEANAKLQQSRANLDVAKANAAQAEADVQVAQANAQNAERNYNRYENLPAAARSKQQLDTAIAAHSSTTATVTAMQKKAASMKAQITAARTAITAAQSQVDSAKAQLEQANLNLSYTSVVSGHAGWVTMRTVEKGDYVQVGQDIMDVVPKEVWVTANFKETQLPNIKPGQKVSIAIDAYPNQKLHGHVDSIQSGTGSVFSLLPAENATGNYVKIVQRVPVKIDIDGHPNTNSNHKLSPGMSVEPKVTVH